MSTAAPAIEERIWRAVTDQLSLLLLTLVIVWACLLGLGRITELLRVRKQPSVPAAPTIQLLPTDEHGKRAFMLPSTMEKKELSDEQPDSPIFRAGGEEGPLAPGSHVPPPSYPHLAPSTQPSRSPLAPPTLRPKDFNDETPTHYASPPPRKETSPPFSSMQSRVEATPMGTESAFLIQRIRPRTHCVLPVTQVPVVRPAPDSPHSSSTDHTPPPSPFVDWTPFIPTGTSTGEYIKKLSRQIVFCGGFSDIFRAKIQFGVPAAGPELKQDFALKILRRVGLDGNEEYQALVRMIDRLNQEVMTWIRLRHPNVVLLVGFTIKPLPSLISPWYERGNIRNYLAHQPGANRLKLIYDVAKGLEYLHSRTPRIAHGDIKPANVLINGEGDALLSDFGLATTLGEEDRYTPSHREGGSIRYMAPELLLGVQYRRTCSADVYSFASLAFEVLTGHQPHRQLTTDGQISVSMANSQGPEYPIDDWSNYPELEPIEGILRRCWSRIPDGRPSMKEIVEELSILV